GNSGACGTTTDHTVPVPGQAIHSDELDWHTGHIGRGGKRTRPHDAEPHACTRNSPIAVPSQNGAPSSSTYGNNRSVMPHPAAATAHWSARPRPTSPDRSTHQRPDWSTPPAAASRPH